MKLLKKLTTIFLVLAIGMSLAGCDVLKSSKSKEAEKYDGIIDTLCNSKVEADLDKFMSLFGSMEELMRNVVNQEVLDKTQNAYKEECGDNMEVTYKIKEEEKVDNEGISNYEDTLEMLGEGEEISEAFDLTVDVSVKGKKGTYDYEMTLSIGNVKGKWIIVNFNDTLLK